MAAYFVSQLACPDQCHDAGAGCPEQLGAGVDDGRPFPLGFRLIPHLSRSKFNSGRVRLLRTRSGVVCHAVYLSE